MNITKTTTRETVEALTVTELKSIVKENGLELEGECRKWSLINAVWNWVEPQVAALVAQAAADEAKEQEAIAASLASPEWIAKRDVMVKELESQIQASHKALETMKQDLEKHGFQYAMKWHAEKAVYAEAVVYAATQWAKGLVDWDNTMESLLVAMKREQHANALRVMHNLSTPNEQHVQEAKASYFLIDGMVKCLESEWSPEGVTYCWFGI